MSTIAVIMAAAFLWTFILWMGDRHSKHRQIDVLDSQVSYWVERTRIAEHRNHKEIEQAYARGVIETTFKYTGENLP